jgi:hypothetical protein
MIDAQKSKQNLQMTRKNGECWTNLLVLNPWMYWDVFFNKNSIIVTMYLFQSTLIHVSPHILLNIILVTKLCSSYHVNWILIVKVQYHYPSCARRTYIDKNNMGTIIASSHNTPSLIYKMKNAKTSCDL